MEQNAREADQGRSNEGRSNEGRSNEGRSNEGSSEATPPRAHSLLGTFLESSTRGIPPDEDGKKKKSSTCSVARRSVTLEGGARGSQPAWDASTVAEETAPEATKSSASGDLRATAEVTAFPLWSRPMGLVSQTDCISPPVAPLHRPRPVGVHPPGTPPNTHTPPYPSLPVLQGYFPVPKPQPPPCTTPALPPGPHQKQPGARGEALGAFARRGGAHITWRLPSKR